MKRDLFKRIVAITLSLFLVLTMIPMEAFASGNSVPEKVDDVYQLKTSEDLYWFAGLVNGTLDGVAQETDAYAVLCNDITLNKEVLDSEGGLNYGTFEQWNPIGSETSPYTGIFDGQGYTIYGLYYSSTEDADGYAGLFGYCGTDSILRDIVIKDSYIDSKGTSGGICGYLLGKLSNCISYATVIGSEKAGGICGYLEGKSSSYLMLENCKNYGTVTSSKNTGGICGYVKYVKINNSLNYGSISGGPAGGIIGYSNSSDITNCTNYGVINAIANKTGGICGSTAYGTISNCCNKGTVSGYSMVGGIIGNLCHTNCNIVINEGKVYGTSQIGGIIGYGRTYLSNQIGTTKFYIDNAINKGIVTGNAEYKSIGGIVGELPYVTNSGFSDHFTLCINSVYNIAKVSSKKYIVGYSADNVIKSENNYYNSDLLKDTTNTENTGIPKTTAQFKSGEVAFLLGSQGSVWRQNLGENADDYPTLDATHRIVYQVSQYDCDGTLLSEPTYKNNSTSIMLNHKYGNPVWSWTENKGAAQATFICENYDTHVEKFDATVTVETEEGTCIKKEKSIHTAEVVFNGMTYIDIQEKEGNITNHKWEKEYTVDEEATCEKEGYKSYHCSVCDAINTDSIVVVEKISHEFVQQVAEEKYLAKEPNCTEPAIFFYSCKCGEKGTETFVKSNSNLGHIYDNGCDIDCNNCGTTRITSHTWKAATCTLPKICTECLETEGTELGHTWKSATCTTPKICTECSETEGTELGHTWKAATCTTPKICTVCSETEGTELGHTWKAATCTTSKICTVCLETDGTPKGHNWKAATCTTSKSCIDCLETDGIPLGHNWKAATCTTPKTCIECGAREGSSLGHSWKEATCTTSKICTACSKIEGVPLGHNWKAATCTTAKTCTICLETEGIALGHNWKAATCTTPKICIDCLETEGIALGHDWKAATCTTAKTCTDCGAREGSSLGHIWKAATCTAPKTCTECGAREGSSLGHIWKAATCTTPKTCTICLVAEGMELGHNWKDATCTTSKICIDCGVREGSSLEHNWKEATCITPKICLDCGETKGIELGHDYSSTYTIDKKATSSANGSKSKHCTRSGCTAKSSITAIPKIASVTVSTSKYTYDGYNKLPAITVKDANGNTLKKGTDYTTSYPSSRWNVGRYKITVTMKGNYSGTFYRYYTIVPKAATNTSSNLYGYDDVKVTWTKAKGASGYFVYYKKSTSSSYTYYSRTTGTSMKIDNLTDGVKYNFKVVPYYYSSANETRYTSLQSSVASVYTLKQLPTPTVTRNGTKVKVKWTNINGESGYQISRSTSKTGTNIVLTNTYTTDTYNNVSAIKGTGYYYKVRAYKTVNGTKIYAPWSNVKYYKR